ncbi:hypothetical protein B4U80_00256, partial [Leptotrombidium deliense]
CVISSHLFIDKKSVIEGDILLTQNYKNAERNEYFLWPNKTIIYDFDIILGYYKYRNEIEDAMKHISSLTCIRFKRRTNEINYMKFVFGEGLYKIHYSIILMNNSADATHTLALFTRERKSYHLDMDVIHLRLKFTK